MVTRRPRSMSPHRSVARNGALCSTVGVAERGRRARQPSRSARAGRPFPARVDAAPPRPLLTAGTKRPSRWRVRASRRPRRRAATRVEQTLRSASVRSIRSARLAATRPLRRGARQPSRASRCPTGFCHGWMSEGSLQRATPIPVCGSRGRLGSHAMVSPWQSRIRTA